MGFESTPQSEPNGEENNNQKATKWLEFLDKNGMKTTVGVFGNETDEEALERARGIDAQLGNEHTF